MKNDVIIACDFKDKQELYSFLEELNDTDAYLKIGMELFYKEGYTLVKDLKDKGYKIFLDLKLCDIPNTVYKALYNLRDLNVDMINVHALGGIKMMEEAKKALAGTNTKLIAVTILTSIDNEILNKELFIQGDLKNTVKNLAINVKKAGLDGVVCSALEANIMKELDLISVTPGIRLLGDSVGDQKRVTTPNDAFKNGSTYIVVGRSITAAANKKEAYLKCKEEFR